MMPTMCLDVTQHASCYSEDFMLPVGAVAADSVKCLTLLTANVSMRDMFDIRENGKLPATRYAQRQLTGRAA